MNEPGSPTKGLSSTYSVPYRIVRPIDSIRLRVSRTDARLGVVSEPVTAGCTLRGTLSGMGVPSLLPAAFSCELATVEGGLGMGWMYMVPSAGVKSGSAEAVEKNFVAEYMLVS